MLRRRIQTQRWTAPKRKHITSRPTEPTERFPRASALIPYFSDGTGVPS